MEGSIIVSKVVDNFLNRTKQGAMRNEVTKGILKGVADNKGAVVIPVMQQFFELYPTFKQQCIDAYRGVFGLNEYYTSIPDDIKASQGAVIDGLCIMYDWTTNRNLGIVTLNNRIIDESEQEVLDDKMEKKIMECNRVGLIHSLRFDFEYDSYGPETATVKCVKHRTKIDEDNVTLVPLVALMAVENILSNQMNSGKMLAVRVVSSNGEEKHRIITENQEHLKHYCDSDIACEGLCCEYYTLGNFMYAPVLGAPSTTAMKTRVDYLNLENIVQVSNYKQCANFGVQKPKNPIDVVFKEQAILLTLANLRVNNSDEYTRIIAKLPDSHVFRNMMDGDIGTKAIANYLHSVSEAKMTALLKMIPGAMDAYEKRRGVVGVGGYAVSKADLYNELRRHVVKVIWKKPNGMYASSICTNSNDILRKVYGEDYFGKYESVGVRISNAIDDIRELNMPLDVACKTYGFSEEVALKVAELLKENKDNYEACFYEALGKKKRSSSSKDGLITARTLSSYIGGKFDEGNESAKAVDYYISIDTNHLVRAEVVG